MTLAKSYSVAVVGATGLVGRELVQTLHQRNFPLKHLKLLASSRSVGEKFEWGEEELSIEELHPDAFKGVDLAFFAVSSALSAQYCPIAAEKGAVCIDKSAHYRLTKDVPLVVPEVNPEMIAQFSNQGIIASPNCVVTPLVQVLAPLHQLAPLKRVVMSSYQSVSGAGQEGSDELNQQVRNLFNFRSIDTSVFEKQIAFNVLPWIPAKEPLLENGSTSEEEKVVTESRKILGLAQLPMAVTCVRVPVFTGHSEAVHIEFQSPIELENVKSLLKQAKGIVVMDDPAKKIFPTPLDAAGKDFTAVGRIRIDNSVPFGISLWLTSDNLRTGAALNAVRIGEVLVKEYL